MGLFVLSSRFCLQRNIQREGTIAPVPLQAAVNSVAQVFPSELLRTRREVCCV